MELKKDCPYCDAPKHLYVNTVKGVFHCQKCKESGPITKLDGIEIQPLQKKRKKVDKDIPIFQLKPLTEKDKIFWRYAKRRNALQFQHKLFLWKKHPGYLFIALPLFNNDIDFIFGRKVLLAGPRYRYVVDTKGVIGKSFKGKVDEAVVIEGFFDLCNIYPKYPCIALMGKGFDGDKIRKIRKSVRKKVHIALDPDALKEAFLFVDKLVQVGLEVNLIHTSVHNDPGEDSSWVFNQLKTATI